MEPLRFGLLGAARIAPAALIHPARSRDDVRVVSVAARDRGRAEAFARRHGVERVVASYEDVVNDPSVDAVYIPLPNSLHATWTLAALAAGKHVLCEKPFTSNLAEASVVAAAATERPGQVVMEAFHYRYHPVAERMREVVASGSLGELREVSASFCFPLLRSGDIRWRLDLAGGALMDAGCYAVHMTRLLGLSEPRVVSASAKQRGDGVDRAMTAQLEFPGGHVGTVSCSMWSSSVLRINAGAVGDAGSMRVLNPLAPHLFHRFVVSARAGGGDRVRRRRERIERGRSTYSYQLDAFVRAVRGDASANLTPPSDSVATMRVIDDIYRAAGMEPRPGYVAG